MIDITEQKKLEQSVRNSEEQFRSAVNALGEGIVLQDENGAIVFSNSRAEEITGLSKEQIAGRTSLDFRWNAIHENGSPFPGEEHPSMVTLRTKEPQRNVIAGIYKPDGSLVWILINTQPLAYHSGSASTQGVVCSFTDITDMKKMEKALREGEERFRNLFTYSQDGILEATTDGVILNANPAACKAFGRTEEEIIGLGRYDLQDMANEGERILSMVAERERTGSVHAAVRFLRRDGTPFPIEGTSSLYTMADGTQRASVIFRDVTESVRVQDELLRAKQLLDETGAIANIGGWEMFLASQTFHLTQEIFNIYELSSDTEITLSLGISYFHPDHQPTITEVMDRLINEGAEFDVELRFIAASGKEKWVRVLGKREVREGKPYRLYGSMQDITAQKAMQIELQASEEKVRSARDFYVSLVGAVNVVLWEAEPITRRVTYISPKAKDMLGYEAEQWSSFNMFWLAHVHPDDRERVLSFVNEHIETEISYSVEYRFLKPDKTLIWISDAVTVVRENGNTMLFRGVMADVTEKKTMYDALVQSHERLQLLLSSSPVPMGLNDSEGNITYLNPAFIETFGYTKEDIPDLQAWWEIAYPDADYREWVQKSWKERLDKAEAEKIAVERFEVVIRCKNNTTKTVLSHAAPLQGSYVQGEHLVVLYDITERKQAESIIKKSQDNLKEAQKLANIGSFEWDMLTNKITLSEQQCRLFGMPPETFQMTYEDYLSFLNMEEQIRANSLISEILKNSDHYSIEHEITRKDGTTFFAIDQGRVIRDESGTPIRMYGTTQDITERKRAEEIIRKSEDNLKEAQKLAKIGSWEWDILANSITWSEEQYHLFGETPETFQTTYEGYLSHLSTDEQIRTNALVGEALEGKTHYYVEHEITRKDGTTFFAIEQGEVVRDATGTPIRMYGTTQDITERKRAEDELLRSNVFIRSLANSLPVMIGRWTKDLRCTFANVAYANYWGKSVEEFQQSTLGEIIGEELLKFNEPHIQRVHNGEMVSFERSLQRPGQKANDLLVQFVPDIVNNEVTGLISIITDISTVKESEQRIRASEANLRAVFDASVQLHYLIDTDYHLITSNKLGQERVREVLGRDIIPHEDIRNLMQPEDIAPFEHHYQQALRNTATRYEKDVVIPQFGTFWFEFSYVPVKDSDDKIIGVSLSAFDITERVRQEEMIRMSESNLRAIMDSSVQAFWLIDIDLRVVAFNKNVEVIVRNLFNKEVIAGKPILDYVVASQQEEFIASAHKALQGKTIISEQDFLINNKIQWFELMYRPTSDQNGEIVGLTLCSTNITERKQQQESLRNINEFIRSLTDALPSMVGYWTHDLVCTFANNAYMKYFGLRSEEIIGNTLPTVLGEKLFAQNKPFIEAALQGEAQKFERELSVIGRNSVSTFIQYIPDIAEDGSVRGFIALITDVSSIKEAEQALRIGEANLRAIMDSSVQAFWLIDKDWQVIAFNRNVKHSVRLMLGKEVQLGVSVLEYVMPEQIDKFTESMGRALQGEIVIYEQEFVVDNETRWVELMYIPTLNSEGEIIGVTLSNFDVTERKMMLIKLADYSQELKSIINVMQDGLVLLDENQRILLVNPSMQKIFGYTEQELLGQELSLILPERMRERHSIMIQRFLESGESSRQVGTAKGLHAKGHEFYLDSSVATFQSGSAKKLLAIVRDITEQVQAQEEILSLNRTLEFRVEERTKQLVQMNQEKIELMGIAAHDLKNPLAGIYSSAQILERYFGDNDQSARFIKMILSASEQMLLIIKNLLESNRLESGLLTLHIHPVEVPTVIAPIVEQYQETATAKGIILHYTSHEKELRVMADELALRQVADNLISNAVKYSPHWKNVWIRVERTVSESGQAVGRIEVQDEGPGLTEEDKQKLFGKFARLSAQPTGGENSTGLGLSIVKKLVELQQGTIRCESQHGKGARFIVELPLAHHSDTTE